MSDDGRDRASLGVEVLEIIPESRPHGAVHSIAWLDRWRELGADFGTYERINRESAQDGADGNTNARNASEDQRDAMTADLRGNKQGRGTSR
jgi:hypothetical protein